MWSLLNEHCSLAEDVLGVVHSVEDVNTIKTKMDTMMTKRDIFLVDNSGFRVRLTLWGPRAQGFNAKEHPVVILRGAIVGDFGGMVSDTL